MKIECNDCLFFHFDNGCCNHKRETKKPCHGDDEACELFKVDPVVAPIVKEWVKEEKERRRERIMNSILISIRPEWVEKILNGEKALEIRKDATKDWKDYLSGKTKIMPEPKTVYIYCTSDKMHLLRRFPGFRLKEQGRTYQIRNKLCFSNPPILNGKVVAKFTLKRVEQIYITDKFHCRCEEHEWQVETPNLSPEELYESSCLTKEEIWDYLTNGNGYAWHITDLEIFDEPKELSAFFTCTEKHCIYEDCHKYMHCRKYLKRPPQSWCYARVEN